MTDPFRIDGPAVISFSGGRTSAYMLRRILDVGLQPDVHILFANTGKESPETLDFVYACQTNWGVPITWVEYHRKYLPEYRSEDRAAAAARARAFAGRSYDPLPDGEHEPGYRIVDYFTAARHGEPYDNLIDMVGLPNNTTRLCTQELKVRVMKKVMLDRGFEHWDNVVGIRSDEPIRVARMRKETGQRWENVLPLADARVTKADVLDYWARAPFDLQLPLDENGETYGGNCDLCFLKNTAKRARLAQEFPDRVVWWATQEQRTGQLFRHERAAYRHLLQVDPATCTVDDGLGDCVCHD